MSIGGRGYAKIWQGVCQDLAGGMSKIDTTIPQSTAQMSTQIEDTNLPGEYQHPRQPIQRMNASFNMNLPLVHFDPRVEPLGQDGQGGVQNEPIDQFNMNQPIPEMPTEIEDTNPTGEDQHPGQPIQKENPE